jgi:hypothetical protein
MQQRDFQTVREEAMSTTTVCISLGTAERAGTGSTLQTI